MRIARAPVFLPCVLWSAWLLSACVTTLEHAPEPEQRDLLAATSGTVLLLPSGDGILNRTVTLVDLPSGRVRKVRVPGPWSNVDGPDESGRLAFLAEETSGLLSTRIDARGLCTLDVASGTVRTVLELGPETRWLRLAPRGGRLVLLRTDGSELSVVDLEHGSSRPIEHDLGTVTQVHWLADGSAFVLVGPHGSARFDAATLAVVARTSEALGPFTPDGSAQLVARARGFALVESLESPESGASAPGRTLADPALFPWPLKQGHAREDYPASPVGLCGPRHGLYPALPTAGTSGGTSIARGGVLLKDDGVLKVCDVTTGAYATLTPLPGDITLVRYSPARLAAE